MHPAVDLTRSPSQELWTHVHDLYARRLAVWVSRRMASILREHQTVEDVIQETFCRAWRERGRLDDLDADLRAFAWLVGIANHVLLEWTRRATRQRVLRLRPERAWHTTCASFENDLRATVTHASARALRDEGVRRVLAILDGVEPTTAELLEMRYCLDLPMEEIARRLDVTETTARKRLERARSRAREVGHQLEREHGPIALPCELLA